MTLFSKILLETSRNLSGKTLSHIFYQYPVTAGPHKTKMAGSQCGYELTEEPEPPELETPLCCWCGILDSGVCSLVLLLGRLKEALTAVLGM